MKKLTRVLSAFVASVMILGVGTVMPSGVLHSFTSTTVSAAEATEQSEDFLKYNYYAASGYTAAVCGYDSTKFPESGAVVVPETVTFGGEEYTVTSIASGVFSNCQSLVSIDMPSVTSIGASAFYNCLQLASVNMPSVTSIGASAFCMCQKLTSVDMPSLSTIGDTVFAGCISLTSASLPNLTTSGNASFASCISLASVDITNVTTLTQSFFSGCPSTLTVYVTEGQVPDGLDSYVKKYVVDDSLKLVWNESEEAYDFAVVVDTDSFGGSVEAGADYLDEVDVITNDTTSAQLMYYIDGTDSKSAVFRVKINNNSDKDNTIRGQVQAYKVTDGVKDSTVTYYVTAPVTVAKSDSTEEAK